SDCIRRSPTQTGPPSKEAIMNPRQAQCRTSATSPSRRQRMRGRGGVLCLTAALTIGAALSGCMVGPDYQRPKAVTPPQFSSTSDGQKIIEWWKTFQDPQLNSLIERAAKTNLDVRAAEARLRQARALRSVAIAGFYPSANFSGQ